MQNQPTEPASRENSNSRVVERGPEDHPDQTQIHKIVMHSGSGDVRGPGAHLIKQQEQV